MFLCLQLGDAEALALRAALAANPSVVSLDLRQNSVIDFELFYISFYDSTFRSITNMTYGFVSHGNTDGQGNRRSGGRYCCPGASQRIGFAGANAVQVILCAKILAVDQF